MELIPRHIELSPQRALAVHRVWKTISASLDLNVTLSAIVDAAQRLTSADQAAVLLLDESGNLVIRVARGAIRTAVGEGLPSGEDIVGQVLGGGRTVLVHDMLDEPTRARANLDSNTCIRAYIAAPLIWRDETLGVLTAAGCVPDSLTAEDALVIDTLAEQAALATSHARLFAEQQRLHAESQDTVRTLEERTRQLQIAQRQLVETEKMRAIEQLAQGIAHEMNTPLGVIISNLSVLDQYGASMSEVLTAAQEAESRIHTGADPHEAVGVLRAAIERTDAEFLLEDLPQLVENSTTSARKVASIVRSLATFVHHDTGHPSTVDVEQALETALTLAWNALKHRATVERCYGKVPPVMGHSSELCEVFVHLLVNAVQALEGRTGSIRVSTTVDGGWVIIRISDTGRGIPSAHLARVFDAFFTTRAVGQGTGLGLTASHRIIARHAGAIELDSEEGRGTTVTVRLPSASSHDAPRPE
jgi:signal transduction histidine kinase